MSKTCAVGVLEDNRCGDKAVAVVTTACENHHIETTPLCKGCVKEVAKNGMCCSICYIDTRPTLTKIDGVVRWL